MVDSAASETRPQARLRSEELDLLKRWLEAPHGSVVLLKGRRGVGKDRLAEEVIRHAHALPKTIVLEGRTPTAGGRSFHPFAEIAHQIMQWAEQNGLTDELVDPLYADLSSVLEHVTSDEPGVTTLDHKLRFFESFRTLLAGIGRWARPTVVVHDLERADSDTLELTCFLADELFTDPNLDPGTERPGMLLLLARDDETTSPIVRDALTEIAGYSTTNTLELKGLDLEGLSRYLQAPHVLEKLLAASDGLPQELDAIFDALPTNVEELFQRKLEGLDGVDQECLRALAVSGRPAAARTLARVVQHPPKQVAKALHDLREARIVDRRISNGEFQFSFARRRDLEVTDRTLSAQDRRRLHRGWADALAKEPDQGGPALLAYHQLRSSEPQRGVALAIRAAETYAVAGALNAAVNMLESAYPHAQGELRLTIAHRLADLAPLIGAPKRALRHIEELKSLLPKSERGPALVREATLRNKAGDHELALEALEQARSLMAMAPPHERASIESAASEAHYHLSALEWAAAAARAGLVILDDLGDPSPAERAALINQLGKIALANGDYESALSYYAQNRALGEKAGLQNLLAMALVNISVVHLRRGDPKEAERYLHESIATARAIGDLPTMAFASMSMGALHHQRGELGRAIEAYRECRSIFRRLGNRTQLARALHNLAVLYLVGGDTARAKAHNDEAHRLAVQSGVGRIVALATVVDGLLRAETGEIDVGEARLREGMRLQAPERADRPIEATLELAEFQLRWRSVDAAADTLEEVERGLELHDNLFLRARADLIRGRVLSARRDDSALDLLKQARDRFVELDRRLFVRDAETALARCALAHGQREACRRHLSAAKALQEEVSASLPPDLIARFAQADGQRQLDLIEGDLEGRSPSRPLPAPQRRSPGQLTSRSDARPSPYHRPDSSFSGQSNPVGRPAARETARKPEWAGRYDNIIGESSKLYRVFRILDRIADTEGTVLVNGESGTGKELVAEAIHRNSSRTEGPFVKLNCAALVESLLMSELFGHERGSFTGAHQRKIGRFEMASGGTLFLDEIGDISPKTQVALLRVLQEREFERVGGGKPIKVDARIIFATNRNLAQMVRDGTFREDLYYRLKGISIDVPPLRDRPEDIGPLASHFLEQYAAESGSVAKVLSDRALHLLVGYPWPGNVRELENIIRSVALFAEGQMIDAGDFDEYRELLNEAPIAALKPHSPSGGVPSERPPLDRTRVEPPNSGVTRPIAAAEPNSAPDLVPDRVRTAEQAQGDLLLEIFARGVPLPELKKRIQEQAIAQALQMTQGNITRAAELLGMRRPRLSQIINASEELKALALEVSK